MADEREQVIRERAYKLWQDEGQPHGRDQAHWSQAEQEHGGDAQTASPLADSEPANRDGLISDIGADLPFGEPADAGADEAPAADTPAHPQTTAAEPTGGGADSNDRIASASGAVEPPAGKKLGRGKARTKTTN